MAKRDYKEISDEQTRRVIADLEARKAKGKLGAKEKERLNHLKKQAGTMPEVPGAVVPQEGLTVDDNIDVSTGRINNPQDLLDQAGKLYDPNDPYWKSVYDNTYNTTYDLQTSGLEERKAREMEEARQLAAERGLPFDPTTQGATGDPNTAYGKALNPTVSRYDQMYKDATNASTLAAQSAWESQGSLANDSYIKHIQSVLGISEAEARAYANELTEKGIDKDYKAKMAAVAASSKPSGSSSGSSSGGTGGFDVVL